MGGKSTYLRQAAMLVLMAQMGSFVPAQSLRLGLVDRIYTRIGASDNVARGRSTFMVEMTETATILNTATKRSLILLDEMGRGTATFDGLSLAWATVEYLHAETGARTLFATHYHELTMLAEKLPRVRNLRVGVKEGAGGIVFLHTIEPGAASKSYGIEVAKLAGLPAAVIDRAKHVLAAAREAGAPERAGRDRAGADAVDHLYAALAADRRSHRGRGCECADAAPGAQSAGRASTGAQGKIMTMTVRQAAGSLLVVGLGGTELTALERAWLGLVRPGGVILFRRNIKDPQQTRALLEEATGFCCPRAVRCVDVEGGTVNRLRDALAPIASAQAVAAAMRIPAPFPTESKETPVRLCVGAGTRRTDCSLGEGIRLQHHAGPGGRSGTARSRRGSGIAHRGRECRGGDRIRTRVSGRGCGPGRGGMWQAFPGSRRCDRRYAFRDAGD